MQLGPSQSDVDCFPSSLELASTFYYSPGICPSGFELRVAMPVEECRADETGWPWYTTDLCTIVIPNTVEVIYSVSTAGGDWEKSTAKGAAANAIGIPIRWHSSDFASTTSDTSAAEASGTSGTSEVGTAETSGATETSSPSGGGGLSTGAKAGIGVGVGVAALAGLGALLWFVLRARRAKQANAAAGGEGFKEPQQQQQAWELDSYQPIPPAELPSEGLMISIERKKQEKPSHKEVPPFEV
ncbi:uncharacterized protein NECHADRAFT_97790 [Fusarium vanettenii 77-13-4]|uniref:Mid2 domain-containing protein n=1 Tax=Fusarium vanettenii (strain ATCC MYA-4622 / CBS 123669 / FGSC 9596 / NRRL 45880 / 77-13-4) TaxID=660122 RepID=C7Z2S2_FUSV7|nr:uncharacterized protein NECHADRAFT_97790 [Fusarium vanettenii 77-13-4]EEU41711.1 hypothetical protein NECHADRAFT_97790 [Fusarium vanettenii 77-13-4]